MLKFLEDDCTWEIGCGKDRYEEEVSKPRKSMDDSVTDQIFGGEQKWYENLSF